MAGETQVGEGDRPTEQAPPDAAGPGGPAPTGSRGARRLTRLAWLWWVHPVRWARRLSAGLATTLADGLYLVAWPAVAALASPAALLLGLAIGALHPGYQLAFSESLPLLLLIVCLGTLSGHLGLLFLAGYVVGDVAGFQQEAPQLGSRFLAGGPASDNLQVLLRLRLPELIGFGVMALPLVVHPVMTKTLIRSLSGLLRLGRQGAFAVSAVLHAGITFVLVFFWTQSVPLLIRPLYTWRDVRVDPAAVTPLQGLGVALAAGAVVVSVMRMALQGMTAYLPRFRAPIDDAEARLAPGAGGTPAIERLPALLTVPLRALATALLLGGIYQNWVEGLGLFLLLLVIEGARARLIPVPLGPWPRLVERVPALLRVIGAFLLIVYLAHTLAPAIRQAETFRPLVVLTGLILIVTYLCFPLATAAQPQDGPSSPRSGRGQRAGTAARAALALIGAVLLWAALPELALADNCQTPSDCFGVQRSASAAAAGLMGLTAISLLLDLTPVVGSVKGIVEGVTGRDLLTGQRLAAWERAIGWVPYAGKVGRVADAVDTIGDVTRTTRRADDILDTATPVSRADAPRTPDTSRVETPPPPRDPPSTPPTRPIDLDSLPRKQTPTRTAADRYETRHTGEWNYQVEGGGQRVWADGVRAGDGDLLDAKFVDTPGRSPFIPDSDMPPFVREKIVAKLEDEFRRYARVVNDPQSPYRALEVITNDARAKPFFEELLRRYNIPGRVVVRE